MHFLHEGVGWEDSSESSMLKTHLTYFMFIKKSALNEVVKGIIFSGDVLIFTWNANNEALLVWYVRLENTEQHLEQCRDDIM